MDTNWIDNLPDANYEYLFGLRRSHFESLRDDLNHSGVYGSIDTNDLALYLLKLKHGTPNRLLSALFRCPLAELSNRLNRARAVICQEFAEKYVGFQRINRSNVTSKFTRKDVTNGLGVSCKDNLLLIEDGIPYLIPNESDSEPRFMCLESVIVFSTTGLIVDVTGPLILEEDDGGDEKPGDNTVTASLKYRSEWLQENDVIVSNAVTRGLIESFEVNHCHHHSECLQPFIPKAGSSLVEHELNNVRNWIAIVRTLIRMVKHKIRSFKLIEKPCWQDRLSLNADLMIVCAMINRFQMINSIPLYGDGTTFDPTSSPEYRRWNFRHVKPGSSSLLEEADFKRISKNQVSFPPMSREDIRDHTMEVFQVVRTYGGMGMATSAASGVVSSTIDLILPIVKEVSIWEPCDNNIILRVLFAANHFESELAAHFWYTVNQHQTNIGWSCSCDVGKLSIWCCRHIASILEDLGYRFHPYGKPNLVVVVR